MLFTQLLSFSPGFSPVQTQCHDKETVETVSPPICFTNTGLKTGVIEKLLDDFACSVRMSHAQCIRLH